MLKTKVVPALLAIALLAALFHSFLFEWVTQKSCTVTVIKTERVVQGGDSRYMVWVTRGDGEEEAFQDIDSWAFAKTNSSDIYGELQP